MTTHKANKGFTLIELLVVIAIIAILAAILFPVFAQAKRAAKGSVAISDAKQMALGQLMYSNDFDDAYPLVIEMEGTWDALTWSYLQQPYMKNWGVLLDPTGPVTNQNLSDLKIRGLWGMPPLRTATYSTAASDFVMGNTTQGKAFTNGQLYYFDGIGGAVGGAAFYPAWGYQFGGAAGLTSSAIANPADQVMIAQAGAWDFFWGFAAGDPTCGGPCGDFQTYLDTPDNFDMFFGSCDAFNTYGCEATICGPIARQRDSDGASVGFFTWAPGGYSAAAAQDAIQPLPSGLTTWAGTDGHVKATPWRQLMGTTIPIMGGTAKAIKAFWPSGS